MELQELLDNFESVSPTGDGNTHFIARCPAHDDNSPSLRIGSNGEKAWLTCYAGCSADVILAKVGLKIKDLYFNANGNGHPHTDALRPKGKAPFSSKKPRLDFSEPTVVYSYTDEDGQELYQNCRYETDFQGAALPKKEFRQRHKNEQGKWVYSLQGVRLVPYRLPQLLSVAHGFFDCEGEKDANTLCDLGAVATNIGKKEDEWEKFKTYGHKKRVFVCEDNDKPGQESAKKRARFWYKSGAEVKILTFRDMPEHSDVTDWVNVDPNHDIFALQQKLLKAPFYHPLEEITIDFRFQPSPRKELISMGGNPILAEGNLAGIVSGIGRGKSHFVEMIAALAVNPECEKFGEISVSLEPGDLCILVDTERTKDDCYYGLQRMWRRTGEQASLLTEDKSSFKQFRFTTTSGIEKAERRDRLLEAIETPRLKLLLIDGLLDFVVNPNDIGHCIDFVDWLFTLANQHKIGIFFTLHGNRNDFSGKGKGWLGDAVQRRASTFLMLKKWDKNQAVRLITSDFENVKVRHGKDYDISLAMQWDEALNAFRFIPFEFKGEDQTRLSKMDLCFVNADRLKLSRQELAGYYCQIDGCSKKTAYRHIEECVGEKILKKSNLNGLEVYEMEL